MTVEGAIVSAIAKKLGELLIQEAISLYGVTDQVEWLRDELRMMQGFLKDADRRQLEDERRRAWVMDVTNAAYDAEDAVETYIYRIAGQRRWGYIRYVFFLNELLARRTLSNQTERIKLKLDNISKRRSTFGIENLNTSEGGTSSSNQNLQRERQFFALLDEPEVIGFKEDMELLVHRLINGELRLSVVSVVGVGGAGKTTLAKKVYRCDAVKDHFIHFRSFVHVSQLCRLREIFYQIINCFRKLNEELDKMNEPQLAQLIKDYLKDKRYLVVIDDIWRKEDWDLLQRAFPDEMTGSRVVITTRIEDVAKHADPLSIPHQMRLLEEPDAWNLFVKKVFVREDIGSNCSSQLQKIGRQIVKRCSGLPLAVVVLGSLLSKKEKTEDQWLSVLRRITHYLSDGQNSCSQILALSYSDLPYHLKLFFLYFGLFPEDSDILAVKVIKLWMAEGLIQDEGRAAEEVGEDYLEELVSRNMIQVARRKRLNGRLVKCRIHDLIRDLCISEAKKANFFEIYEPGERKSLRHVRRLAFCPSKLPLAPRLRSLFSWSSRSVDIQFQNYQLLRVVDLGGCCVPRLSGNIGQLIHLRYLVVWTYDIPSSMSNLSNLQTLSIRSHWEAYQRRTDLPITWHRSLSRQHKWDEAVPNVFGDMKLLRHLELTRVRIYPGPLPLGHLSDLQTLRLEGCKGNVKGLKNLINLRELFIDNPSSGQQFPPNLTELTYCNRYLHQGTVQVLEKLPNLIKLKISECSAKNIVLSEKGFPRLQRLTLCDLNNLETLILGGGAIPTLLSLRISDCHKLKMLPGLQQVTTLKELKLTAMPLNFWNRLRENNGEDWYKIRHIPAVIRGNKKHAR